MAARNVEPPQFMVDPADELSVDIVEALFPGALAKVGEGNWKWHTIAELGGQLVGVKMLLGCHFTAQWDGEEWHYWMGLQQGRVRWRLGSNLRSLHR